jgi:hypothetical protein
MALGFLRGKSGELRAGYQQAAALGPWKATRDGDGGWTVEAKAVHVHDYWISYQPLTCVLNVGIDGRWRWCGVEMLNRDAMTFRVTGEAEK